jgi:hypothetical protein
VNQLLSGSSPLKEDIGSSIRLGEIERDNRAPSQPRAERIHLLNNQNMDTRVADVTIEALKDKIHEQLEILLRVYRDTTVDVNRNQSQKHS